MSVRTRRLALVGAVLLSAYAWFYQGGGWNQNSRFALTRALVEQGSVRLDATGRYEGREVTGDRVRRGRHVFTDKAPGASIFAAPAVAVARALLPGGETRGRLATLSWVATVAAAGVPTALAVDVIRGLEGDRGFYAGAVCGAIASFIVVGILQDRSEPEEDVDRLPRRAIR